MCRVQNSILYSGVDALNIYNVCLYRGVVKIVFHSIQFYIRSECEKKNSKNA